MPAHKKEMVGLKFGKLTVLQEQGKSSNGGICYLCKCECGGEKIVSGGELRRGNVSTCGHCLENTIVGQHMGNLDIVDFVKRDKKGMAIFTCKCGCGNVFQTRWNSLRDGRTKSCGKCDETSLIGKRFGNLTVVKYVGTHKEREFECLCDCGNSVIVPSYPLRSGHTKSCGCIRSGAEVDCINYFKNKQLNFSNNVSFDDLIGVGGGKLTYDFMVGNYLIECQGLQHYQPIKWFGGEEKFTTQQKHDELKRQYAKDHKYTLIEIKYNESPKEVLDKYFIT